MSWLARLKENEKRLGTGPTKPTKNAFVGFVGSYAAPFSRSAGEMSTEAINNPRIPNILEQGCTLLLLVARQALFTERGLPADEAEAVSIRLNRRDAERDERRLCLECSHMYGGVDARRCSDWRQLGATGPAVPAELVCVLQRCQSFKFDESFLPPMLSD